MSVLDQFDLSPKVAVVTGGGRGIGRAIAIGLAQAGATVVPTARTTAEIDSTATTISDQDGTAKAIPADVSDKPSVIELFEQTIAAFDRLDILVNCAGINPEAALGKPETVEIDGFDATIAVNLRGAFLCAQTAAEHLHEHGGGTVINIVSVGGLVGIPRQHPYVASKHGLVGITKSLAIDWAPTIRVNALAPGYVKTDLTKEAIETDSIRDSLLRQTPLNRIADPTEMAGPAVFLASDAAAYVTGTCLTADGGWTAR